LKTGVCANKKYLLILTKYSSSEMINIAILASGNGTNAENIARYFNHPDSPARVALAVTNHREAGVVKRMETLGVETLFIPGDVWNNRPAEVVELLRDRNIRLVALAGFMQYVAPEIVQAFPRAILNIHPSLLPAYGGKGMYGHHVHEAVVAAGEAESGVTVHFVDEGMDTGEIIAQQRVALEPGETPESLEAKIHPIEYSLYPHAIEKVVSGMETVPPPVPVEELWAKRMKMKFDPEMATTPPPIRSTPEESHMAHRNPAVPLTNESLSERQLPSEPQPPTYMIGAILITICCCLPLGIVALIFSSSINSKYLRGDVEGARRASKRTEWCIIAGFTIGLLWQSISIPLSLF